MIQEEGVNINKLDKGCLIFNTNTVEGYKVCVVDSTNKQNDTQYWVTDFFAGTALFRQLPPHR
ncbi:nucleoid-associated protein [Paraflavitalea speifideaquila]|uniref:nucleoid-associated protein n=1 Tax=Paraflavitalea speifideaquila TaxID=3076558 RepID=UPI0028EEDC73|nr:nucleoid-associated protein [Paraflavitalea speifideiaquila]